MLRPQYNRLYEFFEINYSEELEHNQQQKLNKLRDPVENLETDLLYVLSKDARKSFINFKTSKKMIQTTQKYSLTKSVKVKSHFLKEPKMSTKKCNETVNNYMVQSGGIVSNGKENLQMEETLYDTVIHFPQFRENQKRFQRHNIKQYNSVMVKKKTDFAPNLTGSMSVINIMESLKRSTNYNSDDQSDFQYPLSKDFFKNRIETCSFYEGSCVENFDSTSRPQNYTVTDRVRGSKKTHKVRFWLNQKANNFSKIQLLSHSDSI
ncbi:hypothetical protein, no similarity [Maudiozyma barnettii]|uniref:Uncharacterized protein n=1 Tax=Maudiozyma barnettii TaxID=61262 RepID=A0A8H2VKU4_9SACH|nr:hypothetical protein, no similarity [Kazachstania barnettii]CAB4257174.1 hypothetical protein, no similarity [Kazachstania barnettii]CAD1779544.1 hypothetical protein, no similarity [Kazachstania barnettii]